MMAYPPLPPIPVTARTLVARVHRDTAPVLALAALGLAARGLGLIVPHDLVWYIAQMTFAVALMVGLMSAGVAAFLRDDDARRLRRAIPRSVYAALRAAVAVALVLAVVLLPAAPLGPLAPRLAPWAWWTLGVLILLVPRVARRIPHRAWWLLDRRAYRTAPGWDDDATAARQAIEDVWTACYPHDHRLGRALAAAVAFHRRPGRATGPGVRAAARGAHAAHQAAADAAARRPRPTVAAARVARAVVQVVEAMQPEADPRAWRWARTEAIDDLRSAAETLRETMLDDLNRTLAESFYLSMLLRHVNEDPIVVRFGLTLTREELTRWLTAFRDGVAYMAATYGADSLPWGWSLLGGTAKQRWAFARRAHMGYMPPNDTVHVSAASLAFQARSFDGDERFMNHKLAPPGVPAETFTLLEAIEECYHRYQIQALGMRGYSRRDHPIERDILPIWQRANDDLALGLAFADDA